jgi:hypothetical protein
MMYSVGSRKDNFIHLGDYLAVSHPYGWQDQFAAFVWQAFGHWEKLNSICYSTKNDLDKNYIIIWNNEKKNCNKWTSSNVVTCGQRIAWRMIGLVKLTALETASPLCSKHRQPPYMIDEGRLKQLLELNKVVCHNMSCRWCRLLPTWIDRNQ